MMKLNIQLFGGRGASSGSSRTGNNRLELNSNGNKIKIGFNDIQKGDTFEVKTTTGNLKLKVGNKLNNGYYVEGRDEKGTGRISTLVTDSTYKNADNISKRYMIPLSKTKKWSRK